MKLDRPTIITLVITALATLIGLRLLAIPKWRAASAHRAEAADLQDRMSDMSDQDATLERLTQLVRDVELSGIETMRRVPVLPQEAHVMRRLTLPIDGVTVQSQEIIAGSPTDALIDGPLHGVPEGAIPINVEMRGGFESIFALVRSAERMENLVRVDSVRLVLPSGDRNRDGQDSRSSRQMIDASIGLSIVHQRPELEGVAP
ncbi:MAG: hypothetical protein AB8G96_05845 [Phycisphaerales bacterium]